MPIPRIRIIANRVTGKAAHTEINPWIVRSIQLFCHQPAIIPNTVPRNTLASMPKIAMTNVCRAPHRTSACISLPTRSEPQGNTLDGLNGGPWTTSSMIMMPLVTYGLAAAMCFPNTTRMINPNTSRNPASSGMFRDSSGCAPDGWFTWGSLARVEGIQAGWMRVSWKSALVYLPGEPINF